MTDRPRLESCYFGAGDHGDRYVRLAQVLDYTAHQHCPDWHIDVRRLDPPEYTSAAGNQSHVWNTQKLEHWRRRIVEAPDGAPVLLIDGDMMIARSLSDVWDLNFDIAYTIRAGTRLPYNGGVVFLRVSPKTKAFVDLWWEKNLRFLGDRVVHQPWRLKYAGINQSALGFMLEEADHGCELLKLPCAEWNLVQWEAYDPEVTRIVHFKSGLRRTLFNMYPSPRATPTIQELIRKWKAQEKEADKWRKRRAEKSASSDTGPIPSTSVNA